VHADSRNYCSQEIVCNKTENRNVKNLTALKVFNGDTTKTAKNKKDAIT